MTKHITLEEFDPGVGQEWNFPMYPHSGWYWVDRIQTIVYVTKEVPPKMMNGICLSITLPDRANTFFTHGNHSVGDIPWVEVLKMIAIIEHPEMAKELLK